MLQVRVQELPVQPATPFGSVGHGVHALPHDAVEAFETHVPLHRWKPALQTWRHWAPEQVVPLAFGSLGHAAHAP